MCTNERSFDDALGAAMDLPASQGQNKGCTMALCTIALSTMALMHYDMQLLKAHAMCKYMHSI